MGLPAVLVAMKHSGNMYYYMTSVYANAPKHCTQILRQTNRQVNYGPAGANTQTRQKPSRFSLPARQKRTWSKSPVESEQSWVANHRTYTENHFRPLRYPSVVILLYREDTRETYSIVSSKTRTTFREKFDRRAAP